MTDRLDPVRRVVTGHDGGRRAVITEDGPPPTHLPAKIPGVDAGYRLLTTVLPLGRGDVVEREGAVFVRKQHR